MYLFVNYIRMAYICGLNLVVMGKKIILINTDEGQYLLPLQIVAEKRADYFSAVEHFAKNSLLWHEQVAEGVDDEKITLNWLSVETNWVNWQRLVTKFSNLIETDDEYFWDDLRNFKIIEI